MRNGMKLISRCYTFTTGSGIWKERHEVVVTCQEQRGKFYANVHALNPIYNKIGIGNTVDEAFSK
jgi:hypothetical protein